jgi:hypothetical protein
MRRTTIREAPAPEIPDDPFTDLFLAGGTMAFSIAPRREGEHVVLGCPLGR